MRNPFRRLLNWWRGNATATAHNSPQSVLPVPPVPPVPHSTSIPTILLAMVNRERLQAGVPRVSLDSRLVVAARRRCELRAISSRLGLSCEPPASPVTLILDTGYAFSRLCENLASGQEAAILAVQSWLLSAEHKRNMLDPLCIHAGFGLAISNDGAHHWCAIFANPPSEEANGCTVVRLAGSCDVLPRKDS